MLDSIIAFSVRNKLIIILFVLALIGYGSYQVTQLPIDAVPDITDNQVQIITPAPFLSAPDVERLITFPIEQANSNIPGLKEIRSFSRFGLSVITIVFDDDIDLYWARQQITERLQKVQNEIPQGLGTPSLAPVTTGLGEIYQYVVKPVAGYERRYDAMKLRTIQDWIVRRQLLGVPGVADVSSFGGYLKQYEVAVNSSRLASYGLTISDVFSALERNNSNTGGAYIERGPAVLYIRTEGLTQSIEDIERIVIRQTSGAAPVLVRDVADVRIGSAVRYGAMCYNNQGEVAGAVVMMLKGENSGKVIEDIKKRVAEIQKMLPEGVVIEPFLDRSKMVKHAIGTVEKNLLEGSLIVVFILVLFLGNARAGLLVASVIPLSMLFAIILMNLFGVSGNLMSLGALDFGLIVDGAVIIIEAVLHKLHHSKQFQTTSRLSQEHMDSEVKIAAGRMMNSAVFGQIIILIVYLPIFSLSGIEGKMFRPMAQTVAFALLGAFILSLTYVPMMSALVISKNTSHKPNVSDRIMEKLEFKFEFWLSRMLHYPQAIIASVSVLFVLAVSVLLSLGGEFIPQLEEGDFAVDTRLLTGSSLSNAISTTQKASDILLKKFPEVEKVVTKLGSGEIPTDPMPMEAGDMMVILKDKSEWTSASDFPELADKMSKAVSDIPGINTGFQFPVQMRFNELMTGARQDVVCKIFGEDLDTLSKYAGLLSKTVGAVAGAKDIYVETVTGLPQIVITYNRDALASFGIDIATVNNTINAAFAGQSSGLVFEGEKRFDLVVRLAGERRRQVADVENLLIPAGNGAQVPLYQLATVSIKEGPNQIQREDAKRRIVVGFNVRGRDVQSIVNELRQKVDNQIKMPPGYYITYGGAFENLQAAKQRLLIVVPLALALIFLMLYFAFGNIKHGLLIYTAIPLSAIGGIFALSLRGLPFSISAGVGFIALFGVAVLNGIVLMAEFRRLKSLGETDLTKIVLQGAKTRLRPVLMTAAVASLGFLPMALSNGAGAEVQRPLATVVIGGLLVATFLTLFLLPVLYVQFERRSFRIRGKATIVLLLLLLAPSIVKSQSVISLPAAIDTALHRNLQLNNERLKTDYLGALRGTATNIDNTALTGEWGKINSAYSDSRYGISQSISFPTVYTTQAGLMHKEWEASKVNVNIRERDLVKQVSSCYYYMVYLLEKERLLHLADSIYAVFETRSDLRFKLGESNTLERASARNQHGSISIQLEQLQFDLKLVQQQFAYLLHTDILYSPEQDRQIKMAVPQAYQDVQLDTHPFISYLQYQHTIAQSKYKLEKQKLLPGLIVGYYNQSFSGWQKINNEEKFFTKAQRFSSIQTGIDIPLFPFAHSARIRAQKLGIYIAQKEVEDGRAALNLQYQQALVEYKRSNNVINYYENQALDNATTIMNTAASRFAAGEINYIEYSLFINQAIAIRSEYLDAVRKWNETVININYLIK